MEKKISSAFRMDLSSNPLNVTSSTLRLKALQRLCSNENSNYPQGILIVPGPDGRNNKFAIQILKYLFLASLGKDLLDALIDTEYECLEEIVLLIQETSVSVIWNEQIKSLIGPVLFQGCSHIIEYTATSKEDDEIDVYQEWKCVNFKRMMLESVDFGRIVGIPVPLGYETIQDIESWPLIQSFALDSVFIPVGIFTNKYNVVDIAEYIDIMFRTIDSYTVDNAIDIVRKSIVPHSEQLISQLDAHTADQRTKVTADDAVGPLDMLFEFGCMECPYSPDPSLKPILYFGADTNYIGSDTPLKGWQDKVAANSLHVVYESCEPSTGMRWCRTYFLQRGKSIEYIRDVDALVNEVIEDDNADIAEGKDEEDSVENNVAQPVEVDANIPIEALRISASIVNAINRLEALYVKIWLGLRFVVREAFSMHNDVLDAATYIQQGIDDVMKGKPHSVILKDIPYLGLHEVVLVMDEQLLVHIDCLDALGRIVSIEDIDEMGGTIWVYVRVSVSGIALGEGDNIGTVAVGDTFLFAPVYESVTESVAHNKFVLPLISDAYCVTHAVPYYRCILGNGAEEITTQRLLRCTRSLHMLASIGLGRPIETTGTGLLHAPVFADHPLLSPLNVEFRLFTNGFLIEKMYTSTLPILVSMSVHVSHMWTIDASDFLEQSLERGGLDGSHLDLPEGIVIVLQLYSNKELAKKANAINNDMDDVLGRGKYLKYNTYNPLARAFPSLGVNNDYEPQLLAFYVRKSSRVYPVITEALKEWKVTLRIHDIPNVRGAGCKIPADIIRSYLTSIDYWSITNDSASLYNYLAEEDGVSSVESASKIIKYGRRPLYTTNIPNLPGFGYYLMKCFHVISESQRLRNKEYVIQDGAVTTSVPTTQVIFVLGYPGSGILAVGNQIKSRVRNTLSSEYTVHGCFIDFMSNKKENMHNVIKSSMSDVIQACKSKPKTGKYTDNVIVCTIIVIPEVYVLLSDLIFNICTISHAHPVCIVPLLSVKLLSTVCNTITNNVGIGRETVKASVTALCQQGLADMIIFMDETNQSKVYTQTKAMLYRIISNDIISFRITPVSLRLDELCIEYMVEAVEKYSKKDKSNIRNSSIILKEKALYSLRCGFTGVSAVDIPLVPRLSCNPMVLDKGLTALKVEDNEGWDIQCVIKVLMLLFPNATCNTVFDDTWSVPKNLDNSIGLKRCITLAKVKVITNKQYEEGRKLFNSYITQIKATKMSDVKSLINGVVSCYGVTRLSSGKFRSGVTNSSTTSSVSTNKSTLVHIEASDSSILIRPYDDANNGGVNHLYMHGACNDSDTSLFRDLIKQCKLFRLKTKELLRITDLTDNVLYGIQNKYSHKPVECWWFDGTMYVDINGNKRMLRPDINDVANAYIEVENVKIKKFNQMLELVERICS